MVHKCKYCGKVCSTSRGLTQHIQAKEACRNQQIAEYTSQVATDGQVQENDEGHTAEGLRRSKRHKRDATNDHKDMDADSRSSKALGAEMDAASSSDSKLEADLDADARALIGNLEDLGIGGCFPDANTDEEASEANTRGSESSSNESSDCSPNTSMRDDFMEYCRKSKADSEPLTAETVTSIKLLQALRKKKAPLNAYQ